MKTKKILATIAMCAATISSVHAEGLLVSVGRAPDADGGGNSLAFSVIGENNFGFGIGFIFNSEFASKEILDYPVPHNSYTNLGTKRTGNTVGLDGYYYFGEKKSFRPYVGLGIYMSQRKEVAQSNATGWYYTQSDQSATMLSGEVGVQYVSDGGFALGAGYHTVRGANLSIGKAF
jgi:outer membrane protein W